MVDHAHRLAFGAGNLARPFYHDAGGDADKVLDVFLGLVRHPFHAVRSLRDQRRAAFDVDGQQIEIAFPEDFQLVERSQGLGLHEHRLDLGGKDIDAADDQHVVGAAGDPFHPHVGATAAAGRGVEHRYIAGAVADDREGFLGQRGEDDFTGFAVRQRLTGMDIDRFDQEMILENVQTLFRFEAFDGDAGADDFR